ncbi:SCO7613 C-terminal domain-containing membrane protein [Streptomyces sp. NPDC001595]|uniref:SCO7613 C-terminal domain-containing membrane protein n=1 Tax=Streptomyces sp. NPDC001532 TaxID=3154520 RepID=UPI0033258E3D
MTHIPSPAEELRLLDAELYRLDARRSQLLARRGWLLSQLQPVRPLPAPAAHPEAAGPRVQNVLLVLGGVLLTLAAAAFTLVSWGHLGIAGRAAVLGAVTAAALAVPVPLLKRGLRSTAESVVGLGLALTVLDAYALYAAALPEADATGYTAAATAALAALWAAYGLLLPRVTGRPAVLPVPAALVVAQLPLPLWAVAAGADAYGIAAALLVTAAADTVAALRMTAGPVRIVAAVGAYGVGGWGVLAAGWLSWTADGPGAAARAAGLLLLGTAIALAGAWAWRPAVALGNAVAAGLLAVAALGGVPRAVLPDVWAVPVHLLAGIALPALLRVERVPEVVRRGLTWASGAVQALAVLAALPVVAVALLGPVGLLPRIWSGVPADAREAVTAEVPWPPDAATAPLVLAVVAGVLALAVRGEAWRSRALDAATALLAAAVLVVPPVLRLPYAVGLVVLGAMTVGLLLLRRVVPTVLALLASFVLALLSLAAEPATLTVLALLTALFATGARRPVPVAAAAGYATALVCAAGAALDLPSSHTALAVLLVPVAAAAWAPRTERATRVTAEVSGAVAALVAVGLAVPDAPMLALVLALAGVIAAGIAVRADRRPVGYVAAALFVLAAWVRLAAWEVTVPEAYTLPVAVPALLVGLARRRRDPQASSWTAYGPGLAAGLLPSLLAVWGDAHWQRPLLLGLGALAVTLLGAGHSLRAPLLLGGSVLVLVVLHELAPYLVQVAGALPRWVPPALAGLLLLALGATYEQRLRDVRRAREMLRGMR